MRQLIILGNGFDLSSGLKSSYKDFIDYMKKMKNVDKTKYIKNFPIISREFSPLSEVNIWYTLLLHSNLCGDINWKDIEAQIYKWLINKSLVLNIVKANDRINNYIKTRKPLMPHEIIVSLSGIDDNIYTVALERIKKLNTENNPIDAEMVATILLNELKSLEKDFETYLFEGSGYKYNTDGAYFINANKLLKKIVCDNYPKLAYIPNDINEEHTFNIISFNYTDPWSNIWKKTFNVPSLYPSPEANTSVHGLAFRDMDNSELLNRVVFGVDSFKYDSDENAFEIKPSQLEYRFTKIYRTLVLYSDVRLWHNKRERGKHPNVFNPEITEIKFYGHSLGEADYSYFQQMFDYYNLYSNNELVLYFYYSQFKGSGKTDQELLQDQVASITRLIEKYGSTMDNLSHGKNLLTRLLQTNRIIIKKI